MSELADLPNDEMLDLTQAIYRGQGYLVGTSNIPVLIGTIINPIPDALKPFRWRVVGLATADEMNRQLAAYPDYEYGDDALLSPYFYKIVALD